MAVQKSPGQKRQRIVLITVVILFAISTFLAGKLVGAITDSTLAWVDDHSSSTAIVTELVQEEETYRNRKGRERTRTIYYLSYSFSIDGEVVDNQVSINNNQFSNLAEGDEISVWYDNKDYYTNDTQENIEDELAGNTIEGNAFSAAMYTAPASIFLYWLLSLIFVRESKKALPEGFYNETSWLDVDDKYLVALDGSELVYFNIDKSKVSSIQEAYQKGASLEELIGNSKSSTFKRIPLNEISELTSNHNSDVISIEHNDESHSVEFLNQTVKAHALDRIIKHIPTTLSYSENERTRLQAAVPNLVWLTVLVAIMYFVDVDVISILLVLYIIFSVFPKIISRLLDPTVTKTWETLQVEGEPEATTE